MKKLLCVIALSLLMGGCAYQPAINAYEGVAGQSIDAAAQQDYKVKKYLVCHTPYATLLSHPEDFGWLNKLCAPGAGESTPDTMLQGGQLK